MGWARRPAGLGAAIALALVVGLAAWSGWSAWRAQALWQRALAATSTNQWDRAEGAITRLTWYRPSDPKVLRMGAQVALARGDRTAAVDRLAAVPDSAPDAARAHLTRGRLLLELFRARAAEAAFRKALALDPDLNEARLALVAILGVERRQAEQTAELWKLHDDSGQALLALRMLAHGPPVIPPDTLNRSADEGQVLEGILAADPADPFVRPAFAFFLRGRGRTADARRLLENWLRDHPADPAAREEWLACLLDERSMEAARTVFEQPPPGLRPRPRFWSLRGDWFRLQGRAADELACRREALRLDPLDPEARYRLGQALRASGHDAEAAGALRTWKEADELKRLADSIPERPTEAESLIRAGRLCGELGRHREAKGWLALAVRLDPNNEEARGMYDRETR